MDHPFAPSPDLQRGPTPPHSIEAEESVIGGILVHPRKYVEVAEFLKPEDFYHPALRSIYEAMLALDHESKPIDAVTVIDQMKALETVDKLRAFGGPGYLTELMGKVVTVENIGYHARIVRGKATARHLVDACREIAAKGYGEYGDVDEYLDQAERDFFQVTQTTEQKTFKHVKPYLKEVVDELGLRAERKNAITGVPTGFVKLDAMTAGLQLADFVVVAARPSQGKTSFIMNAALSACTAHKIPVLVFSLEMSGKSLMECLLCSQARVDSTKLRGGFLETRDWTMIYKAASEMAEMPMYIDDSGAPTLMEIRSKARRWKADQADAIKKANGMAWIIIDYMQLIMGRPRKDDNRQQEMSEISRGLKALAKELNVPVVALSQLNRQLESRADKRPMMSDLRESGAIEQDADVVAFIFREETYCDDCKQGKDCNKNHGGIAEIIVGKQRNGPTGMVRLAFLSTYTKFENLSERED